jgi:FkbM family methyltransferase
LVLDEIIVDDELGFEFREAPQTILDLGANIGLTSIYLANRFPQASIVAVEMDPSNVELLRRNVHAYPRIAVVPKAIWHEEGYVCIENPQDEPWAFRARSAEAEEPGAVEAISIPALLRSQGWDKADFVKLDIEGAELELLVDGRATWLTNVAVMAIELHDRFRNGCTRALQKALETIPSRTIERGTYTIVYTGDLADDHSADA